MAGFTNLDLQQTLVDYFAPAIGKVTPEFLQLKDRAVSLKSKGGDPNFRRFLDGGRVFRYDFSLSVFCSGRDWKARHAAMQLLYAAADRCDRVLPSPTSYVKMTSFPAMRARSGAGEEEYSADFSYYMLMDPPETHPGFPDETLHTWLYSPTVQGYGLLAAGMEKIHFKSKPFLRERNNPNSPVSSVALVYSRIDLEFSGVRISGDPANDALAEKWTKRGSAANVPVVLCDLTDRRAAGYYGAARYTGTVALTRPGNGYGDFCGDLEGSVTGLNNPVSGAFDENTRRFFPD